MTEDEFRRLLQGIRQNMGDMSTDVNGLRACPRCGRVGEVRAQTPPDDDGMVRRAYLRCLHCQARCPDVPGWTPVHWAEAGKLPFRLLRDHWNTWTEGETP